MEHNTVYVSTSKTAQWWDNPHATVEEEEFGQAESRLAYLGLAVS